MPYCPGCGTQNLDTAKFKLLPLFSLIVLVTYIIIESQKNAGDYDNNTKDSVWKIAGIGLHLTLVGSFVLTISKNRKYI
jgi:hypothetical protein